MFLKGQVHCSSETNHRSDLLITKRKKDSKVKYTTGFTHLNLQLTNMSTRIFQFGVNHLSIYLSIFYVSIYRLKACGTTQDKQDKRRWILEMKWVVHQSLTLSLTPNPNPWIPVWHFVNTSLMIWRKCDKIFHGKWGHWPWIQTADKIGVFNFSRFKCWKSRVWLRLHFMNKPKWFHPGQSEGQAYQPKLPFHSPLTLQLPKTISETSTIVVGKFLILERWNEEVRSTGSDKIKEGTLLEFRVVVYLCTSTQVDPTQPLTSWQV